MNAQLIGQSIRALRLALGQTQRQLADPLFVSDKTVSKWERGLGCPDLSVLTRLASVLGVDLACLLSGDLTPDEVVGGNMKQTKYYICPSCHSLTTSSGHASVSCCGKTLTALEPQKAQEDDRLTVEHVENKWFVHTYHTLTKDHFISCAALATGDRLELVKLYPEWDMQARFKRRRGTLIWYCTEHGLFYQFV